jgi:hypothetical protein
VEEIEGGAASRISQLSILCSRIISLRSCSQSDHSIDHELGSGDHSAGRMRFLPSQNESRLRSKFTREGSKFRQMRDLYFLRCRTHMTQPPLFESDGKSSLSHADSFNSKVDVAPHAGSKILASSNHISSILLCVTK